MSSSVSRGSTVPVGLCGELTRMSRVRSVTAHRARRGRVRTRGATSGTVTSRRPRARRRRRTRRRTARTRRPRRPGSVSARIVAVSASVAPAVTSTSRLGVDVDAVQPLLVRRDRLAQHRHPATGRVLVHSVGDRLARGLEHLGRAVLVGEALPEVDRAGRDGERTHLGEDGRLHRAVAPSSIAPRAARCQEPGIVTTASVPPRRAVRGEPGGCQRRHIEEAAAAQRARIQCTGWRWRLAPLERSTPR